MMTFEDEATIRNAIMKRLSKEPGVHRVADIEVKNFPDAKPPHMRVGVWLVMTDRIGHEGLIDTRSFFDLPAEFERSHLLNEIDEIAEHVKVARKDTKIGRIFFNPFGKMIRKAVVGTGFRGRWPG